MKIKKYLYVSRAQLAVMRKNLPQIAPGFKLKMKLQSMCLLPLYFYFSISSTPNFKIE